MPGGGLDRAQRDLDRELGSVLPPPGELQCGDRRLTAGVVGAQVLRGLGEALDQQQLDRLADQLVARVAEQRLGLRVDEHDRAGRVDDDCSVGRGLEQVAEAVFALACDFARLPRLGDVADEIVDDPGDHVDGEARLAAGRPSDRIDELDG